MDTSADLDMQLMQLKHCDGDNRSNTKMPYKENNARNGVLYV